MPDLTHITSTTGDTRLSPRAEVMDETIERLRPLLVSGGQVETLPWQLSISEQRAGSAAYKLTLGRLGPVILDAMVCWDEDESTERAWPIVLETVVETAGGNQLIHDHLPREMPLVPWLVVIPHPTMAQLPLDQIGMLGDFERCLAWALIEAHHDG